MVRDASVQDTSTPSDGHVQQISVLAVNIRSSLENKAAEDKSILEPIRNRSIVHHWSSFQLQFRRKRTVTACDARIVKKYENRGLKLC